MAVDIERYNPKPGSKMAEMAARVEAAHVQFAEVVNRLEDLQSELKTLPGLHWKMDSQETGSILSRHAAIEALIDLAQHARARADASLRARQRELAGTVAALDQLAARVRIAKQDNGGLVSYQAESIRQATVAYEQARRALCEPPAPAEPAADNNGRLVENVANVMPQPKQDMSHVASMDPFIPVLQRGIKQ